MKALLSLLTASTLGISFHCPAPTQASIPVDEALIAQRGWDDEEEDLETEPVDRSTIKDGSAKNTWIPLGYNDKRIAVFWARLATYKPLNENSFRVQVQYTADNGQQYEGRMDVNCKNKDYYIRPNGVLAQNAPWAVIPKGSGYESLAVYFCKRTSAKSDWGYKDSTRYLWDAPAPPFAAVEASGEWIQFIDRSDVQAFYNDGVIIKGDAIIYASWVETTKGDMSSENQDIQNYYWAITSCKKNIFSPWIKLDESVAGIWGPSRPGRPDGSARIVRKKFCK